MSKCSSCDEPLLATYCRRHQPKKSRLWWDRLKLFLSGYRSFNIFSDEDMIELDELENELRSSCQRKNIP